MVKSEFKILAIDDNKDNLIVLKALINETFPNVQFIPAMSGAKGIELFRSEKPDLVLLDIVMPHMDGFEVCTVLKSDPDLKHVPVIMITAAKTDKESRIKSLEKGADAFLSKPVDNSELKAQVSAMLRIKESEDKIRNEKFLLEETVKSRTEELSTELNVRKKTEEELQLNLNKLTRSRQAVLNLMEDLKTEISERIQIEENLKQERNLLRTLIDTIPDPVSIKNVDGKYIMNNLAHKKLIGISEDAEIAGKTAFDFFTPEVADDILKDDQRVVESGKSFLNKVESIHSKARKGIRWHLTSKIPLLDSKGKPVEILTISHDITDRKEAEEKLKKSEEKYRMLIENQGEGLGIVDLEEKFIFVNPAAEDMFGVPKGKLINRYLTEFIEPEQMAVILKESAKRAKNRRSSYEFVLTRPDGIKRIILITATPQHNSEGALIGTFGVFRDITERKQAENALRESEEKLELFFKQSLDGFYFMMLDEPFDWKSTVDKEKAIDYIINHQRFTKVNDALVKQYRSTREELLNRTSADMYAHDSDYGKSGWKHLFDTGKLQVETRERRADGTEMFIEGDYICMFDPKGRILGHFGIQKDVTDRKLAEDALQHSHSLMRYIIEHNRSAIAVHDRDMKYVYVSESYLREYNLSGVDIIGKNHYDVMPDLPQKWRDVHKRVLKGEVLSAKDDLYEKADGTVEWTQWECRPWYDFKGDIGGIIIYTETTTERMKMEQKIRESEAYYRTLVDVSPDGILIADMSGRVTYGSIKTYEIFGIPPGTDITGTPVLNWVSPAYHGIIGERVSDIVKGNIAPETREYQLRKHDGTIFWGELSSSPLKDSVGNQSALMIVCRDISQRKSAEAELIYAKEKAEESDKLKTAFLHNISHEIRTPMNAIVGFSTLLREPDRSEETRNSYIDIIMNSSNHLLSILTDIIEISNIEAGIVSINKTFVHVNEVLQKVYDQYLPKANGKRIELRLVTPLKENEDLLETDRGKFLQIVSNLLDNAIKFTAEGKVEFGYKLLEGNMEFYISDTGDGIPDKLQSKIFDRFYQAENTISRKYEGTGIGLSITKSFIEFLGGKIYLNSEVGKGSVFYFTLPFAGKVVTTTAIPLQFQDKSLIHGGKKTILIAEDEINNFLLLEVYLSKLNHTIIHAFNGKEAVEKCRSGEKIDLVIMDIKMPVMDGYEATRRIKELYPELPVIAQTAFAYQADREKAMLAGCDDYMSKPINKAEINAMVTKYLGIGV